MRENYRGRFRVPRLWKFVCGCKKRLYDVLVSLIRLRIPKTFGKKSLLKKENIIVIPATVLKVFNISPGIAKLPQLEFH